MKRKIWWAAAILVIVMCSYVTLVSVPKEAIFRPLNPVTNSPADVGLIFENFVTSPTDADITLAGWWMPAEQARATLVFIHGGGSNRYSKFFDSFNFYRAMVDRGVGVVVVDLRNHGNSGGDGKGLQFGLTEKHDAMAAIEWARLKNPQLPIFAMGLSMGGATVIHAAHDGAKLNGLILLDSLLDTTDTFRQGAWVGTGISPALFAASAWSASAYFGLPTGSNQALELAVNLDLPILAIQDPDDPVTRAQYSSELAVRNPRVTLWTAPPIPADHPDLEYKGRWGTHVAAFKHYPQETVALIMQFVNAHR